MIQVNPSVAGIGTATSEFFGVADYNDLATQTTPISFTATPVKLTNDNLGPSTAHFGADGVGDTWNSSTNLFDFSKLPFGTVVTIRVDFVVTTSSPNQRIGLVLKAAIGSGGDYSIPIDEWIFKSSGAHQLTQVTFVYIGNAITKNYGAAFYLDSDASCTIKVNGWAVVTNLRT